MSNYEVFPIDIGGHTVNGLSELRDMAEELDNVALYTLGDIMYCGLCGKRNYQEGHIYISIAAYYNNTSALINIGNRYEYGEYIELDPERALNCYLSAYNLGDSQGLVCLGLYYLNIETDKQNNEQIGKALLRKAMEYGNEDAIYYCTEYYTDSQAESFDYNEIINNSSVLENYIKDHNLMKYIIEEDLFEFANQISISFTGDNKDIPYKTILTKYIEDVYRIHISLSQRSEESITGSEIAGTIFGNVSNASTIYGMDKFITPKGHGFAAERANYLLDKLSGKQSVLIGDDNAKWGADRVVNGINIQSKYCASGSKCISECFHDGKFKYFNSDGTPMQIEVPSDKYESAVQAMENRITKGEVPGISDPNEAKNIVRKGHFTYEQAKNIAKAGTIESITFDAVNGAIVATYSLGISTALSFATSIWNGEDYKIALNNSIKSGLKISGVSFVTSVVSSQLAKTGLNSALVGSTESITNVLGPKAASKMANAFRSGKNIYGAAAMKSTSKLLRTNIITSGVSVVVLSSVDVANLFSGRISGKQLFKNIANTASSVAGGTAGWIAGATIGSVVPVVGTVVGGLVGSFAGGSLAGKASKKIMNSFIEDDAEYMVKIIEDVFTETAVDYLLSKNEADKIVDMLKNDLDGNTLKDMYSSSNRKKYAKEILIPYFDRIVQSRKKIKLPSADEISTSLKTWLEELSDVIDEI